MSITNSIYSFFEFYCSETMGDVIAGVNYVSRILFQLISIGIIYTEVFHCTQIATYNISLVTLLDYNNCCLLRAYCHSIFVVFHYFVVRYKSCY